jgi:hypothetical protein
MEHRRFERNGANCPIELCACAPPRPIRAQKTAPALGQGGWRLFLGVCAGDAERETPQTLTI